MAVYKNYHAPQNLKLDEYYIDMMNNEDNLLKVVKLMHYCIILSSLNQSFSSFKHLVIHEGSHASRQWKEHFEHLHKATESVLGKIQGILEEFTTISISINKYYIETKYIENIRSCVYAEEVDPELDTISLTPVKVLLNEIKKY